jgi:hypothetical protein
MLKMDRETIEGLVALLASVMERLRPDSARLDGWNALRLAV